MSVINIIMDTFYNQIAKPAATPYTLKKNDWANTVFYINFGLY